MIERIPNIVLITIDCLRTDFLNNYLSLLTPRGYKKNMLHFRRCITTGSYTWASIPSILSSQYPSAHVFGKNKSTLTIADTLRNIRFETIELVASEGIEFLVSHYVTKFDDVITPKNMKSNFNTTRANRYHV